MPPGEALIPPPCGEGRRESGGEGGAIHRVIASADQARGNP